MHLSVSESNKINAAAYTHDYCNEAIAAYNCNGTVMCREMQMRFEASIAGKYNETNNIGGVCIYRCNGTMVAFYDYENFVGTLFN